VLVDPGRLVAALRLPADTTADYEPLSDAPFAPERVALRPPGEPERLVLLRSSIDPEASRNHLAVMEALTNAAFPFAPRLLAVVEEVAVEEWVEGTTALAIVPPPGACEAAMDAFAALHALPIREGLNWGASPKDLLPDGEVPLHRLGFAAHEREPASGPLAAGREVVLTTPFGFAHGAATAANVLLARGRAVLVNFEEAGYSSQYMDVAAFLLTSGLEAPARRALAAHYAHQRGSDAFKAIDGIDLAGILWGIDHLLRLPRRLVEALGDDLASEALRTAASRVERGIRVPAGDAPAAAAIRTALWPE
jgi:hypothetical protein